MRLLAPLLFAITSFALAQVQSVPQEVKVLLAPSLDSWRKLQIDPACNTVDGHSDHCSQLRNQRDSQILTLSQMKGKTADESIAVLFSFGVRQNEGDQGHDLICIAAARGSGMIKALKKYRSCTLDISAEYPKAMRSEIPLCQRAIDLAIDIIRIHSAKTVCAAD